MFANLPIIDCHVHLRGDPRGLGRLLGAMEEYGVGGASILGSPVFELVHPGQYIDRNLIALVTKLTFPERPVYAFSGLYYNQGAEGFIEQVERALSMGFDGVKMIESKPDVRRALGRRLDGGDYEDYFAFLEKRGVPLLWHAADPEEFWDEALCPPFAKERGWFYGDGTYPAKEQIYGEVENVLDRHPQLNVVFPHFFFKSASVGAAQGFLDRHPAVRIDITPGSEMYLNFSRDTDGWRDFFTRNSRRILYGTDSHNEGKDCAPLYFNIRSQLEEPGFFTARDWGWSLRGFGLGEPVLRRIYSENFLEFVGGAPQKANAALAAEEAERLLKGIPGGPVYDIARKGIREAGELFTRAAGGSR